MDIINEQLDNIDRAVRTIRTHNTKKIGRFTVRAVGTKPRKRRRSKRPKRSTRSNRPKRSKRSNRPKRSRKSKRS